MGPALPGALQMLLWKAQSSRALRLKAGWAVRVAGGKEMPLGPGPGQPKCAGSALTPVSTGQAAEDSSARDGSLWRLPQQEVSGLWTGLAL